MSYAQVTAKNSKQSAEEARAAPVPELEHETASTTSLIDIDSPHVSSVPSTMASQDLRTAPATRAEREAREDAMEARLEALASSSAPAAHRDHDRDGGSAKAKGSTAKGRVQERAKRFASSVADGGRSLRINAGHPAVVGNVVFAVALVAGGVACFGRVQQRLHARAISGWQALGLGAAVLGAVGVVDYYTSAFLVRKYPLKK